MVTFPRSACWTTNPNCLAVLVVRTRSRSSFSLRYSIDLDFRAILVGCLTSIEWKRNAGNPRRLVGSKIYRHHCNVFRFTPPAKRDFRGWVLSRPFWIGSLGKRLSGHLRLNHCWAYAVHSNLVLRVI